jgi:hypothetical protein
MNGPNGNGTMSGRARAALRTLITISMVIWAVSPGTLIANASSPSPDAGTPATLENTPGGSPSASAAASTVTLLVQFKPNVSPASAHASTTAAGATTKREHDQIHTHELNVPAAAADRILGQLRKDPNVARVHAAVSLKKSDLGPNDPMYTQQWNLPKIDWDKAFATQAISGSANLAVLDTGINAGHVEFSGHSFTAVSFTGGDALTDPNGHGTALAGIAAANANDGTGMAGVAYSGINEIMSVQVLQADGTGNDADIVAGVLWAADNGANVILLGFSSPDYSYALADAIAYAWGKGALVVAATGNDGSSAYSYPAGMPYVVGVGATDQSDAVAAFSNTGSVSVNAPGVAIPATAADGTYTTVSGTSAAAAEAAGLAVLLMANGETNAYAQSKLRAGAVSGRIDVAQSFGADATLEPLLGTPTGGVVDPTYVAAVTSLVKLHVGTTAGAENYLFTTGDAVAPESTVDPSRRVNYVVKDASGNTVATSSCSNGTPPSFTYTIQAGDPISTTTASWTFTLQAFGTTGSCSGSPSTTTTKSFDVARATTYDSSALATTAANFNASGTAYVVVNGATKSLSDWSTTWVSGTTTQCANTAGTDRPDTLSAGQLPGGSFLQYQPGGGSIVWNKNSNYDAACPAFSGTNEGAWSLKIQADATHFVTLAVFALDVTNPAVSITSGPAAGSFSNTASPTFGFSATDTNLSTAQCKLDAGALGACTTSTTYALSGLSQGSHTITIQATDLAGNTTSATRTWTVDSVNPVVSISSPANNSFQTSTNVTVTFAVTDTNLTGTDCQLDGGAFAACTTATTYALTGLGQGSHTATVRGTDAAGNTGSASVTFTVDTVGPAVAITSGPAASSFSSTASPTFGFTVTDASSTTVQCKLDAGAFGACTTSTSYALSGLGQGSHTITIQATDAAGNTGSTSRTWTVDTVNPVVSITSGPAAASFSNTASPTFGFSATDTNLSTVQCKLDAGAFGACTTSTTYALSGLSDGSHTITIQATDLAGNTASATRTWTVDTTNPAASISSPANNALFATASVTVTFAISDANLTARECKLDSNSFGACTTTTTFALSGLADGSHTVTVRGTDAAGNTGSASVAFTVDTVKPTIAVTFPVDGTTYNSATWTGSIAGTAADATSGVNKVQLTIEEGPNSSTFNKSFNGTSFASGLTTLDATGTTSWSYALASGTMTSGKTYRVTAWSIDNVGNQSLNGVVVYTYQNDTTPPSDTSSMKKADNTTYTTNTWTNQNVTVTVSGTDAGSGMASVMYSASGATTIGSTTVAGASTSFTISNEGTTTVSYTLTDVAGNTTTGSFTIKIDKTAPNAPSASVSPAANGAGWNNTNVTVSWTSNGDAGPLATQSDAVTCSTSTSLTTETAGTVVSGTCTDTAGNTSASTSVTVKIDKTAPKAPTAVVTPEPNGAGWNNTSVTVSFTSNGDQGTVQSDSVTCTASSTQSTETSGTTFSGTCTDAAGNTSASASATVKVDLTKPSLTLPANITAEATSASGTTVTYSASASDALSGLSGTISCLPASGSTFAITTTTVNCSATDNAGNTQTGSFTVKVQDTTAPIISGTPANQTLEATSASGASATFTEPTWLDAVDGNGTAGCDHASGATYPIGTTTVTCSVTDLHGNAATPTSFTITVQDTTKPTIDAHADVSAEATSASGAAVTYTSPATHDAVDGTGTASCSPASGSTFALGATTVTCTKTDAHGNVATPTTFTVTVHDTTAPVVTAPADQTAEATSAAGAAVTYSPATWTDAVGGSGTTDCSPASGSTFALGQTTVTCSKTDAAGNTGTATFKITVHDTTAPTIDAHDNVVAEATSASGATVTYTAPATHDAVDGTGAATCSPASGSGFALGTTTVTCNVTDAANNHATATTFTVTVHDTTAPAVSAPADKTVEATGASGAAVTYSPATWTDAVDGSGTVDCAPASGSTFSIGAHTVTCSSEDAGHNTGSATFTITVQDTTKPTIDSHADVNADATSESGANVSYTSPATHDIVDGLGVAGCTPASTSLFPIGSTTVTCTATDAHANVANATTFSVIVAKLASTTTITANGSTYNAAPYSGASVVTTGFNNATIATPTLNYAGRNGTSYGPSTTPPTNAGDYRVRATFAGNSLYMNSQDAKDFTIAKADASITVNGYSGTYDGNAHGATGSASGVLSEDLSSLLHLGASFTDVPGGTANWTFDGNVNYKSASGSATISISQADASITVTGYSGTYDAAAHGATGSATGVKGESLSSLLHLGASFTDYPGGTANWTFDGNTNYKSASGSVAISIAKADASITVNGYSGTYDGNAHGATGSASGVLSEDLSSLLHLGASFTDYPGGTANWTFDGNTNYKSTSGSVAIDIAKAVLTVTANNAFKNEGQPNPSFGASYTGFQGPDTQAVVNGSPSLTTTADANSLPGNYTITAGLGTLSATNYSFAFQSGTLTVNNIAPTLTSIVGPTSPLALGAAVTVSASFTDAVPSEGHTCTLNWGDGTTTPVVTPPAGNGTCSQTHTYATSGVYTVTIKVTDQFGASAGATSTVGASTTAPTNGLFQYVVVYDANNGFVTGGGWIMSPVGACKLSWCTDNTTGKATFGFVSKYQKGATVPTGNTEFQFQAGNLNFKSTSYDWLVISGAKAQYKGSGTINGAGSYQFILTAWDGDINGGGGIDRFRIKIIDNATNQVVYDNQMGAADTADPTTALGGGSVVIHK